jgi:hypothetical protein
LIIFLSILPGIIHFVQDPEIRSDFIKSLKNLIKKKSN